MPRAIHLDSHDLMAHGLSCSVALGPQPYDYFVCVYYKCTSVHVYITIQGTLAIYLHVYMAPGPAKRPREVPIWRLDSTRLDPTRLDFTRVLQRPTEPEREMPRNRQTDRKRERDIKRASEQGPSRSIMNTPPTTTTVQ